MVTPFLNGIAESVKCVFSALVVLSTRLPCWLQCMRAKNNGEKLEPNKHENSDAFPEIEGRYFTPVAALAMHTVTILLHFSMIYAS